MRYPVLKLLAAGGAALMLATGCAAPRAPLKSVVSVTGPSGTVGGDVYQTRRSLGEDLPHFKGDQVLEIRADDATKDRDDKTREIIGAECTVQGDVFSAKVITPSGVRIPLYGHRSTELTLECTHPEYQPMITRMEPYNHSKQQRQTAARAQPGLLGLAVGALVSGIYEATVNDVENDIFKYRQTPIKMLPPGYEAIPPKPEPAPGDRDS
ncbi:MAG: hypothetical protein KTR21_17250 [Rhodobacteraceae bacterium]|nr:hypothetical protein [Paracoccaceae bacterium]